MSLRALDALDQAELYRAAAPGDARRQQAFAEANVRYQDVFRQYASNHRNAWSVIRLAEQRGFDVLAQRIVMSTVPADLRAKPAYSTDWPGVNSKAMEISAGAGFATDYSTLADKASAFSAARTAMREGRPQ